MLVDLPLRRSLRTGIHIIFRFNLDRMAAFAVAVLEAALDLLAFRRDHLLHGSGLVGGFCEPAQMVCYQMPALTAWTLDNDHAPRVCLFAELVG